MNILYIAPTVPSKSSPTAGGQLAYYYVSKLNNKNEVCLKVLCLVPDFEQELIKDCKHEFDAECFVFKRNKVKGILNKLNKHTAGFVSLDATRFFTKKIRELDASGFAPDYVVFDWEQMSYLYTYVKNIWKDARTIVIEQDVLFQSLLRHTQYEKNPLKRILFYISYKRCIRIEKKFFLN